MSLVFTVPFIEPRVMGGIEVDWPQLRRDFEEIQTALSTHGHSHDGTGANSTVLAGEHAAVQPIATDDGTISIGNGAQANSGGGISIGLFAITQISTGGAIAIGDSALVESPASEGIAIGVAARVQAARGIGIGNLCFVDDLAPDSICMARDSFTFSPYTIAIGEHTSAGTDATTGTAAVVLGNRGTASGTHGLALGYFATSTHTASVALGAWATTTDINQIMLGASTHQVHIPGTLKIPTGAGSGLVWTSDAVGVGSWATAAGGVTGFATPAIVLGTAAGAGAATTAIRSDSTIVAFDTTVPSTQAFADAAAVGVINFAARRDHKHAMPANPVAYAAPTVVLGTAAAAGSLATLIRSDATIAAFDATVPTTIEPDDAAAAGSIAFAARRDHKHAVVAAVAGTSTPGDAAAEGTATSFARSDHVHARETIPAVKVNRSATQSINNNTITLLNWNQEQYDTAAMHDNTTNNDRLTCVVAGLHHFQLNLEFAADADGFRGIHIVHNVAGVIAKFYLPAVVVAISPILYCAVDYQMTVGQYVYAEAWHTAGNALLVGNSLWDAFSGRWVRP